jgi:predicted adenine nucleotide alpha hydrolase (AANH) superfamily ATPase
MLYWSPSNAVTESWEPLSGWNSSFSEKDKLQCTNLFFFFKNKKGFKENVAEMLAQMVLYKQKYNGMKYSEEQESILQKALAPVFNSV